MPSRSEEIRDVLLGRKYRLQAAVETYKTTGPLFFSSDPVSLAECHRLAEALRVKWIADGARVLWVRAFKVDSPSEIVDL